MGFLGVGLIIGIFLFRWVCSLLDILNSWDLVMVVSLEFVGWFWVNGWFFIMYVFCSGVVSNEVDMFIVKLFFGKGF